MLVALIIAGLFAAYMAVLSHRNMNAIYDDDDDTELAHSMVMVGNAFVLVISLVSGLIIFGFILTMLVF